MIDFAAWRPPAAPALTGPWAPNDGLSGARLLAVPGGGGPEDVAVGPDGTVHTGVADGRIVRWVAGGVGEPDVVAHTGGRPLGVEYDESAGDGSLIVCDADRGLLRVTPAGGVEVLVAAGSTPRSPAACGSATTPPSRPTGPCTSPTPRPRQACTTTAATSSRTGRSAR